VSPSLLPAPPPPRPDWRLFLTKFLKHGRAIAALAPNSPWLSRELVRGIDFGGARAVVELGAGTGPVTAELLRSAPAACRLVIVERDPDFCRRLRPARAAPGTAVARMGRLRWCGKGPRLQQGLC
jgi:phospholipid N-methyltransferase